MQHLTVHNFHSPGEHSLPSIAACDNGAGKIKHNHLSHSTGSLFIHLGRVQQRGYIALLKDKSAWRWWDLNHGSQRESRMNTPIYNTSTCWLLSSHNSNIICTPIFFLSYIFLIYGFSLGMIQHLSKITKKCIQWYLNTQINIVLHIRYKMVKQYHNECRQVWIYSSQSI